MKSCVHHASGQVHRDADVGQEDAAAFGQAAADHLLLHRVGRRRPESAEEQAGAERKGREKSDEGNKLHKLLK